MAIPNTYNAIVFTPLNVFPLSTSASTDVAPVRNSLLFPPNNDMPANTSKIITPRKICSLPLVVFFNESFFVGHFPQKAVMPGVLIVEAMAQASGILGFKTLNKTPADGSVYLFVGADNVRFKRQVVPGDQLLLEVDYVSDRCGIWKFDCHCYIDNELAASASIICADRSI